MKKTVSIFMPILLILLCLPFILGYVNGNRTISKEKVEPIEIIASVIPYETLETLIGESKLVVAVKVKDEAEVMNYENATFTKNQVEIQDVILGGGQLKGTNVEVLELGDISKGDKAVLQPGKEYLLFLQTYEGPVTSDAYVVTGVYQGKFELTDENKLVFNFKPAHSYHKELADLTLDEAKEKIKQVQ